MNQQDCTELSFIEQMNGQFCKLQQVYLLSQLFVRIDRILRKSLTSLSEAPSDIDPYFKFRIELFNV